MCSTRTIKPMPEISLQAITMSQTKGKMLNLEIRDRLDIMLSTVKQVGITLLPVLEKVIKTSATVPQAVQMYSFF